VIFVVQLDKSKKGNSEYRGSRLGTTKTRGTPVGDGGETVKGRGTDREDARWGERAGGAQNLGWARRLVWAEQVTDPNTRTRGLTKQSEQRGGSKKEQGKATGCVSNIHWRMKEKTSRACRFEVCSRIWVNKYQHKDAEVSG